MFSEECCTFFVDVNLRLFGVCSYADFAKQRSPRRTSKKRRELHRTRLERETPGACRSQRRPPRRSVGMRVVSRQGLCHARVSIVRLVQWSKVGRVAWRTIIVLVAATTDVIIVCRWRAPSVGHGSRLKVVACFCFDTFLRSMHIDESTIQNIEQYLES